MSEAAHHNTIVSPPSLYALGAFLKSALTELVSSDAPLLTACAQFARLNAALAATPDEDDPALAVAWQARQAVVDRLVRIRPLTGAGRRAKAAVGVAMNHQDLLDWIEIGRRMLGSGGAA